MFYLLLFAITLSAGFLAHAVCSLLVLAGWRVLRRRLAQLSPTVSAQCILALRLCPVLVTFLMLSFLVVPAFLTYEPHVGVERVTPALVLMAAFAVAVLLDALLRFVLAFVQSVAARRSFMKSAREERIGDIAILRCASDVPVMAVLGVVRPRIFVSEGVCLTLSQDELAAALAHEVVHARRFDVLKKALLQVVPKILPGVDGLALLTHDWERMCELAADEQAVSGSADRSLHLASALVKMAGLRGNSPAMPAISAALVNVNVSDRDRELLLSDRVMRLIGMADGKARAARSGLRLFPAIIGLACALGAVGVSVYPQALSITHEVLEMLARS